MTRKSLAAADCRFDDEAFSWRTAELDDLDALQELR